MSCELSPSAEREPEPRDRPRAVPVRNILSIAGTDPTGGAGIHADLKTFSALGTYGMATVTALVAQNTQGVRSVHPIPPDFVAAQIDAVFDDVHVDAVKIGMLGDAGVVRTVADAMRRHRPHYLIVDPVMVAKSGHRLLTPDAVTALRVELLPLADLVTPNLAEAADLLGRTEAVDETEMHEQVGELGTLCPGVLLKGGHLRGHRALDLMVIDGALTQVESRRITTLNDHGTGCTLSAAIAALRPQRVDWPSTLREAKNYLTQALQSATVLDVGQGHGPQHHFHAWWPTDDGLNIQVEPAPSTEGTSKD